MTALAVFVDGDHLATVDIGAASMINISVSASRWADDAGFLDVSGAKRTEGTFTGLTWLSVPDLKPGQKVVVSCVPQTTTSPAGKTLEEMFPVDPKDEPDDFTMTDERYVEIEQRPFVHRGYRFKLTTADGEYVGQTSDDEYGFTFSVRWIALHHPGCAHFSLRSNTVAQLRSRSPSRDHIRGHLWLGQSVAFQYWPIANA